MYDASNPFDWIELISLQGKTIFFEKRIFPDQDGAAKIKVLGVLLEGPAHSAGVRQGDELLSVNGLSVKGKSAFEVFSMLQGPQETFVDIEVIYTAGRNSEVQNTFIAEEAPFSTNKVILSEFHWIK
ncbi:hypothetical protein HPP92_024443 [Vanilla planifolia]|uniref:PDZ domain-containing protein n=1 Tax=Vanilla planifolia TaxID=51239 RepID=A0A835UCZ4_VANPL|nr:hypothetical protein HPP92_024443 [Vanilla planifolia]